MNEIATLNASLTMTSREIAELTSKRHDNVVRDIRDMLGELTQAGDSSDLRNVGEEKDDRGFTAFYSLDRELTYTLITGYSAVLRNNVVKRWLELEVIVQKQAQKLLQNTQEQLKLVNGITKGLYNKVDYLEAEQLTINRALDNAKISKESRTKGDITRMREEIKHLTKRLKHSEEYTQYLLNTKVPA
jgi:phage regulator Rha-like protein